MRRRWIIAAGLVALGALCIVLVWPSAGSEQRAAEATRRALRKEGFKTDLSDFDLSVSLEMRARAAALTHGEFVRGANRESNYGWSALPRAQHPELMKIVGTDAALVPWKEERLLFYPNSYPSWPGHEPGGDLWPALRAVLDENRADLDAACEAALSGPIRFNLVASHGSAMLLPHLAAVKSLSQVLGTRMILELHDNQRDAAWTNLLAATRLATAYDPEPAEVSQMVRCGCATTAYNLTWQALQADGWGEDRLAALRREWESVDFLKGLPETAAFTRASMVATCQSERREPFNPWRITLTEVLRSPRSVWYQLTDHWRRLRYRHHGTYEDERDLLLYYRNREVELRHAVQSPSWFEMRPLPGVTNRNFFISKHASRMQCMMNLRQLTLASFMYGMGGGGVLARAADTEARRRLIISAIALERYRGRHGSYPATLQALVPDLLPKLPMDFMDGQQLRYRLTGDGHFVLYSVGLDCTDNGGKLRRTGLRRDPLDGGVSFRRPTDADLVWPRPASSAEAEHLHQEEMSAQAEQTDRTEGMQADFQWRRSARRQAKAEAILQKPPPMVPNEPAIQGRPLSQVLRNEAASGTNQLTLTEMLTLKQVITGGAPEIATFELPIKYDVLTNLGSLHLWIDCNGVRDEDSDTGYDAEELECNPATNGNCLLVWNTIYEVPGKHAIQAGLVRNEPASSEEDISGPVAPFVVSNLCQFSLSSASFQPATGVNLLARLPESNGTFRVELKSPDGECLRTINGNTSNGVIKAHWDLIDDHGRACTNESYDSVFHITLPDSGRSQTLKGP
jgi:hypothetical protein